jgi:hypothetical protein
MPIEFDYGEIDPASGRILRQPRRTVIPENGFVESGDMRVDAVDGRFFYYVKASAASLFTPEVRAEIEKRLPTPEPEQPEDETAPVLTLNEAALDSEGVTEEADESDV